MLLLLQLVFALSELMASSFRRVARVNEFSFSMAGKMGVSTFKGMRRSKLSRQEVKNGICYGTSKKRNRKLVYFTRISMTRRLSDLEML